MLRENCYCFELNIYFTERHNAEFDPVTYTTVRNYVRCNITM